MSDGLHEKCDQEVMIVYTNYRGEKNERRIVPGKLWFGSTDWHPDPQWMLDAVDIERQADRSFAVQDIHSWSALSLDVRR